MKRARACLRWVQRQPIHRQLRVVMLLLSGLVALAASLVSLGVMRSLLFQRAKQDMEVQGAMLVENLQGAVSFRDASDAAAVLRTLSHRRNAVYARLVLAEGDVVFAEFLGLAGAEFSGRSEEALGRACGTRAFICTVREVRVNGVVLARLWLVYDTQDMDRAFMDAVVWMVLSVGLILAVAAVYARYAGRLLAEPLERLAATVSSVSREGNLQLRAEASAGGEVGQLVKAFNEMLRRIGEQQAALNRQREALTRAERIARLGHWSHGTGHAGIELSEGARWLLGGEQGCFSGNFHDCLAPEERERFMATWMRVRASGVHEEGVFALHRLDGERLDCRVQFIAEPQEGGGQVFGTLLDITQERRVQQELLRARDAAEAASRAKSEFLAMMSHELRTPLNPIIAGSDMLMGEVEDPAARELLQMIQGAGEHLLGLINDVLHLSKLEARKIVPSYEPMRPEEVLESVDALFRSQARQRGLSWEVSGGESLPDFVVSDIAMLRQILINLVSNAVKFTHTGSVCVRGTFFPEDTGTSGKLVFSVKDSGVGIPAHLQEQIFEPFTQADNSVTRKYGGTGIGLSISRKLAQLLGGSIAVTSREGEGSEFVLSLTVRVGSLESLSAGASHGEDDDGAFRHLRLLVVDDDRMYRSMMEKMLMGCVGQVDSACDGMEALERLRRGTFDLVLLDVHMPHMGGLELLQALASSGGGVAVAMVTADIREEVRQEAMRLGVLDILLKPVRRSELLALFRRLPLR